MVFDGKSIFSFFFAKFQSLFVCLEFLIWLRWSHVCKCFKSKTERERREKQKIVWINRSKFRNRKWNRTMSACGREFSVQFNVIIHMINVVIVLQRFTNSMVNILIRFNKLIPETICLFYYYLLHFNNLHWIVISLWMQCKQKKISVFCVLLCVDAFIVIPVSHSN